VKSMLGLWSGRFGHKQKAEMICVAPVTQVIPAFFSEARHRLLQSRCQEHNSKVDLFKC
jgi:hypothetical protein